MVNKVKEVIKYSLFVSSLAITEMLDQLELPFDRETELARKMSGLG